MAMKSLSRQCGKPSLRSVVEILLIDVDNSPLHAVGHHAPSPQGEGVGDEAFS